jgi:large subunit ribosomal protein L5e
MYTKAHAAIREDPAPKPTEKEEKYPSYKKKKRLHSQRIGRIQQKIKAYKVKMAAEDAAEEED